MNLPEIEALTNTQLLNGLGISAKNVRNTSKGLRSALKKKRKVHTEENDRVMLLSELAKRLNAKQWKPEKRYNLPETIFEYLRFRLGDEKQELFYVVLLNCKFGLVGEHLVSKGTLTGCLVEPRDVFREALKQSAASIIVAHNHPSMDVSPSQADINTTQRLVEVGKIMKVPLIDHVIVTACNFFSMNRHNLM